MNIDDDSVDVDIDKQEENNQVPDKTDIINVNETIDDHEDIENEFFEGSFEVPSG